MNNTAVRIWIAAGIVAAVLAGVWLARASVKAPEVVFPSWSLNDLPLRLGPWSGERTELDPRIVRATQAAVVADRLYRDGNRQPATVHTAMYRDHAAGVYHTPVNCYRAAGWRSVEEVQDKVAIDNDREIAIKVSTWEREGDQILVVYWYELGEHVLFDRFGLGTLRLTSMRGLSTWPPLIKVMLQVPASDPKAARARVLDLAERIARWLHRFDASPTTAPKEQDR